MHAEMAASDRAGAEANLAKFIEFAETLNVVASQIAEFKSMIAALPRLTGSLNRSKRGAVETLDELIRIMANGRALLLEAIKTLGSVLEQGATGV
jgi:hypothetical protein